MIDLKNVSIARVIGWLIFLAVLVVFAFWAYKNNFGAMRDAVDSFTKK